MYCSDEHSRREYAACPADYPCIPEQVYTINDGSTTGMSTVGFRSANYTPAEAAERSRQRKRQGDSGIELAANDYHKAAELATRTAKMAETNNQTSKKRLDERIHDSRFWKTELEREIQDLIDITQKLIDRKTQFETALTRLQQALHICTDNLNARQRRYGEDKQQDEVESQLIKELDTLNKAIALYKSAIEHIENQIKRNRDIKQDLEMIWSNKVESMDLISTAAVIDPTSINKQFFDGEARRHPLAAQATLESWAQHSHDALLRAEHERMASNQLLTATANLVNDVSKDITEQKDAVNVAFAHNVEAKEAEKADYMRQLKENVEQISKTEQAIKDLEHAIADKSKYIQTVQTRLHLYNQRPCVENVRDNAQQAMLDELQQLEAAVDQMRDQVNAMQNTLRLLQDNQVMFEKQIQMKLNSIQVDRDHCQRHRAIFPDAIRLQGH